MNQFTTVSGRGKYPRAIRELQQAVGQVRPGFVAGARVSHTARGVLIEPDASVGGTISAPRYQPSSTPRWL